MDTKTMQQTTIDSYSGAMTFPEIVMKLASIGVESYTVDFLKNEKTFYLANGETFTEKLPRHKTAIPPNFDHPVVQEAIRASQQKQIDYPAFVDKVLGAGTAVYTVYISGKQAIYFGRRGEMHIEKFPGAK